MGRIYKAYREVFYMFWKGKKRLVVLCICVAGIAGLLGPITVYGNREIFNKGIEVAKGNYLFSKYINILALFILCSILPQMISAVMDLFIYPQCQLFLRTEYRGRMLQKLKKIEYKHFENKKSVEIIDKAYSRAEEAALHLFPQYIFTVISSLVCVFGIFFQIFTIAWWMPLTILFPYIFETYLVYRSNFDIYEEMETYWNQERQYSILGNDLKDKDTTRENKLNQASNYLIEIYRKRLNTRNSEYEKYYYYYLKKIISSKALSKFAQIVNVVILFVLFYKGTINIGQMISFTTAIFSSLWVGMDGVAQVLKWSGHHINSFDYYRKYFELSEDKAGMITDIPSKIMIEFRDVSFRYPDTDKFVLNGISFKINPGEKISIVGENGEGKTTLIKLLLGLYRPDEGEILISGKNLEYYSVEARIRMFGTIFQDFNRYALSVKENISVGLGEKGNDESARNAAIKKAKVDEFLNRLPKGEETILTRNFTGGVDLSGGEWQRIAIARALIGDKPILILDEPTSQLDPMAESKLYSEFMEMSKDKTAVFITHRLGSTMITDRILVISQGRIVEEGTHQELIKKDGIYANMFNSQKQWYKEL